MCFKKTCLRGDLFLSFSFVRMFLAVKHYFLLGFDLRLVRLVLVSMFRCLLVLPVNFGLRPILDVRFDSLDFVSA